METDIKNNIVPMGASIDTDPSILETIKQVTQQRACGRFDNMLPLVEVVIPDSVVISCPVVRQHLSQAKNCKACGHFNGIVQTTFNDEYVVQWDHKFAVSCAFPVDRKCSSVCFSGGG